LNLTIDVATNLQNIDCNNYLRFERYRKRAAKLRKGTTLTDQVCFPFSSR